MALCKGGLVPSGRQFRCWQWAWLVFSVSKPRLQVCSSPMSSGPAPPPYSSEIKSPNSSFASNISHTGDTPVGHQELPCSNLFRPTNVGPFELPNHHAQKKSSHLKKRNIKHVGLRFQPFHSLIA